VPGAGDRIWLYAAVPAVSDCNGSCIWGARRPTRAARFAAVGRTHTHRLRVRYSECDLQGHVFNANFFSYFDLAITELWRASIGGYQVMLDAGFDLVVVEATARFKAPARFEDDLAIEITVTHLGTTSMRTALRVLRDDTLLVEGEMVHVFIRRDTTNKTPIPPEIRAALEGSAAAA
jgi:acyl-CoA thioester hydrolase